MKLAFYTDPLETFNLKKDSTYALMMEAKKRGHALHVFYRNDLALYNDEVSARIRQIELT